MTAIDKLINIARAEIGYTEKKSNASLDSKTANVGDKNYTKYARDLDAISGFYNSKKNGFAWCDVFTDWCFVQAFGVDTARKLICQTVGRQAGAGCKYSMNYYKNDGRFYTTPAVGDQIFFYTSDKSGIAHTGIVCGVDDVYVYTIEGNTRPDPYVVENGGMVCEKKYSKTYESIAGYGRPDYTSVEVKDTNKNASPVLEWQKAAITDGFKFPKYGADGKWGAECETVAKQVIVKLRGTYLYKNLTKFVQREIGMNEADIDGLCGKQTEGRIADYQNAKGLPADGIIDYDDWKMMLLGVVVSEDISDTSTNDNMGETNGDLADEPVEETPAGEDVATEVEGEIEYIKTSEEAQNFLINLLNHIIDFIIRLFKK